MENRSHQGAVSREVPENKEPEIARVIYEALCRADRFPPGAYVGSSDELRAVPIDGTFDLLAVARIVLRAL